MSLRWDRRIDVRTRPRTADHPRAERSAPRRHEDTRLSSAYLDGAAPGTPDGGSLRRARPGVPARTPRRGLVLTVAGQRRIPTDFPRTGANEVLRTPYPAAVCRRPTPPGRLRPALRFLRTAPPAPNDPHVLQRSCRVRCGSFMRIARPLRDTCDCSASVVAWKSSCHTANRRCPWASPLLRAPGARAGAGRPRARPAPVSRPAGWRATGPAVCPATRPARGAGSSRRPAPVPHRAPHPGSLRRAPWPWSPYGRTSGPLLAAWDARSAGQTHPAPREIRMASTRLRAPVLRVMAAR